MTFEKCCEEKFEISKAVNINSTHRWIRCYYFICLYNYIRWSLELGPLKAKISQSKNFGVILTSSAPDWKTLQTNINSVFKLTFFKEVPDKQKRHQAGKSSPFAKTYKLMFTSPTRVYVYVINQTKDKSHFQGCFQVSNWTTLARAGREMCIHFIVGSLIKLLLSQSP